MNYLIYGLIIAFAVALVILHVVIKALIRYAKKEFETVFSKEISEGDTISLKYVREEGDYLLEMANTIVWFNKEQKYIKEFLQKSHVYWLAKLLTPMRV